jgi:NADH dehydrogenase FAD-containing subunit
MKIEAITIKIFLVSLFYTKNIVRSWIIQPPPTSSLHTTNANAASLQLGKAASNSKSSLFLDLDENSGNNSESYNGEATTTASVVTTPKSGVAVSSPPSTGSKNNMPLAERQRMLQTVLEDRNTGSIATKKEYAIADGSLLHRLNDVDVAEKEDGNVAVTSDVTKNADKSSSPAVSSTTTTATESKSILVQKIERMIKPRAYPLFLLEKGVEIVEAALTDMAQLIQKTGLKLGSDSSLSGANDAARSQKERIVILGTGWGGASFLKDIDTDIYDVTVISPRNHFVFTPMLAGACVGTVELRTLCEPIREINRQAKFFEATATTVNSKERSVTCESVICEGNSCTIESFDVPYDRLLITVGAQTNTYGIPGVKEHCNFLKSIPDARRIKSAMVNCFERANLPNLSDEERINCLTFAVIGAGPTGIEFAAELRDFVEQDGPKYYPELIRFVRIKVIEASPTVLAPFDKSLQQEAIKQMQRDVSIMDPSVRALLPERFELTELLLESSVKEVGDRIIALKDGREIPYGMAVWAAGNGPIPLTLQIIDDVGAEQKAMQDSGRGRLVVDPWLRVVGSEGRILALGDCACACSLPRQLPATAQVAAQQGEYIAKLLNKRYNFSPDPNSEDPKTLPPPLKVPGVTKTSLSDEIAGFAITSRTFAKPFQFLNLGILAYTGGGSALAQVTPAPNVPSVKGSGKLGNAVWRSVYLSKQVSWRNRLLVLNDWTNRRMFGRDITRL